LENKENLFIFSGFIAFSIYLVFLFIISAIFEKKAKVINYGFKHKTTYEIAFIDNIPINLSKNLSKNKKSNSLNSKLNSKKSGTLLKVRKIDFKSLFSKISKESKKVQDNFLKSKGQNIAKRTKGKGSTSKRHLNKIFDKIQQNYSLSKTSTNYDEYYSKISEIITKEWNSYAKLKGSYKSIVLISINRIGVLSYKIKQVSISSDFNDLLESFLFLQSQKSFPPYLKKRHTNIKLIFEIKE